MQNPDAQAIAERKVSAELEPHAPVESLTQCPRCHEWRWCERGVHAFLLAPCTPCKVAIELGEGCVL
jgi:hypothetical protein